MKNKLLLIVIVLIVRNVGVQAQNNKVFKSLRTLYNNLSVLNGNLYFFNKYGNLDTNYFSKPSMKECLNVIRLYSLKRTDIDFSSLSNYIPASRIKNEVNFGKIISDKPKFNDLELKYSAKLDSFFNSDSVKVEVLHSLSMDSSSEVKNLLFTSSHTIIVRNKISKMQKKLLKILAVYENDKLQLIVYSIHLSLTDSYINAELILK